MKKIFYILIIISMSIFAQNYNFEPAQDYEKIELIEQEYSPELQEKNKKVQFNKENAEEELKQDIEK